MIVDGRCLSVDVFVEMYLGGLVVGRRPISVEDLLVVYHGGLLVIDGRCDLGKGSVRGRCISVGVVGERCILVEDW